MFYEDNRWIPLSDVSREVFDFYRQHAEAKWPQPKIDWLAESSAERMLAIQNAKQEVRYNYLTEATFAVWEFLDSAKEIGVTMPNGKTVLASPALVGSGGYPGSYENHHMNFHLGTVGSGYGFDDDMATETGDPPIDYEKMSRRFGSFMFQPIVLKRKEFETHFKRLKERETGEPEKTSERIVSEIVNLYRTNPVPDQEAKALIAPEMTYEAWRAHRKDASMIEPAVSKRGPKSTGQDQI